MSVFMNCGYHMVSCEFCDDEATDFYYCADGTKMYVCDKCYEIAEVAEASAITLEAMAA